jgi:hypothetical protein
MCVSTYVCVCVCVCVLCFQTSAPSPAPSPNQLNAQTRVSRAHAAGFAEARKARVLSRHAHAVEPRCPQQLQLQRVCLAGKAHTLQA